MEKKLIYLDYLIKDYEKKIKVLTTSPNLDFINEKEAQEYYASLKCEAISILSSFYPNKLKLLKKPPLVIYYYGDISLINKEIAAVMGSYQNTLYGQKATEELIKKLNKVILTGFSFGVEQLANKYANKKGLESIIILPCGLNHVYPNNDNKLFNKIKENNLIISIFSPNISTKKKNFKIRNELIGALCNELYILEADNKCGVLKAVDSALESANEVYVLPGSIFSKNSKLSNYLIFQGANILLLN